ncbi:MAG: hypothetical protein JRG86_16485 [Deltaproteobacteria bacterium]|jgi:hypothetical protein|nr:hypothetical protein [Deltaproteobacteria bacterium]
MALSIVIPSPVSVSEELRRLTRRVIALVGRRRTKQRARFWSEVHEGEREAAAKAGDHAGPGIETRFGMCADADKV